MHLCAAELHISPYALPRTTSSPTMFACKAITDIHSIEKKILVPTKTKRKTIHNKDKYPAYQLAD